MSISNADILAMPDYTDAELLKLVRKAIADILLGGQSVSVQGRTLTRADLPELRATAAELQEAIAAAGGGIDPFDGIALIQWNEPR